MKHLIKATLGFGLALSLWQVPADANLLNLKKKEQVPNNSALVPQSNAVPQTSSSVNSYNKKVASKNSIEARKYLIENEDRFQGDYDTLLGNFLNYIYSVGIDDMKKKAAIAIIAEHLYKSAFVVDKEINAFACLVNIENTL